MDNRRRAFASQAELFDRLAVGEVVYEYSSDALQKLNALVGDKGRMLDVGCGDGLIGAALDADTVVGIDISLRCATLSQRRGLGAAVADASSGLPFASASFDTVACIDVLHHLGSAWDTLFPELDRVLRPGGCLCIVEPDARNPFVRWTQAPRSPIRVAPWHNEPAIHPADLTDHLDRMEYTYSCEPIHIEGRQMERSVFPLTQRLLKAPIVMSLALWYRSTPNKFALVARKPAR